MSAPFRVSLRPGKATQDAQKERRVRGSKAGSGMKEGPGEGWSPSPEKSRRSGSSHPARGPPGSAGALTPASGSGILQCMSDVTAILSAIEAGDAQAANRLLPLIYDELRRLAAQKLAREQPGQTLDATALVSALGLRPRLALSTAQPAHRPVIFARRWHTFAAFVACRGREVPPLEEPMPWTSQCSPPGPSSTRPTN